MRPFILLDLDGTVLDIRERYCRLHEDLARDLGQPPLRADVFWQSKREKMRTPELLAGWPPQVQAEYEVRWVAAIERRSYVRLDTLLPGVAPVLQRLSRQFDLVLATLRRDEPLLADQLDRLNVNRFFRHVLAAGPARGSKADIVLPFVSANGRNGLVVGDSEADVEAARAAGLPAVCVLTGIRSEHFLSTLRPDHIIDSLDRLPDLAGQMLEAGVGAQS